MKNHKSYSHRGSTSSSSLGHHPSTSSYLLTAALNKNLQHTREGSAIPIQQQNQGNPAEVTNGGRSFSNSSKHGGGS